MHDSGEIKILSIDAWRDESGWYWNDHRKVATLDRNTFAKLDTTRKLLRYMRRKGYLTAQSAGRVLVEDEHSYEGIFIEIQDRHTREPLFAISSIH